MLVERVMMPGALLLKYGPKHLHPSGGLVRKADSLANRHVKRRSILLVTRETQMETTVRYHLIPVRMAIIRKTADNKCWWEGVETREPWALLAGARAGTATVGISVDAPQKAGSTAT